MTDSNPTLFVTGAGGHLGKAVVKHLLAAGVGNIAAGTRNPSALSDFAGRNVAVRYADFDDAASLNEAFAGSDRILIVSAPDTPEDPPRRLRQHLAAVRAATEAGAQHIVYTSMLNPEPGSPIAFAQDHYETEQAIERSGVDFTILRPCWYTDSVFMWLPQAIASGMWATAAGDGRTAFVWRDDLAQAASMALSAEGSAKQYLDVTGPEALTAGEIIATANDVLDTSIALVPMSEVARKQSLEQAGLPSQLVDLLVSFEINTAQGRLDVVSETVARLTGKPPRTLREFLKEKRDALLSASVDLA